MGFSVGWASLICSTRKPGATYLYMRVCSRQTQEQLREGSGGAAAAVKKFLVPQGCIKRLSCLEAHRSDLVQICLHPPRSAPLMVQGVYMPFDLELKSSIYKALDETCYIHRHRVVLGDTLSPFLFNCLPEPLTRWLQVGGRGYSLGRMTKADDKLEL